MNIFEMLTLFLVISAVALAFTWNLKSASTTGAVAVCLIVAVGVVGSSIHRLWKWNQRR